MSKKDSYWFKHDSTAGRALKMRKMAHIYGHWGKGVYWDVCEILRDQENYSFEKDESSLQMLSDLIGCKDENKFISWYKDCIKFGLLKEQESYFYSPALSENMETWETKKSNGSKGGRPRKTETKPKLKPKQNLNDNRNKTIIEDNSTKEEEYITAYQFLKSEIPTQVNEFEMKAKREVKEFDKFIDWYNADVEQKNDEFVAKKLMGKLKKLKISWVSNQKEDEKDEDGYLPEYKTEEGYLTAKGAENRAINNIKRYNIS